MPAQYDIHPSAELRALFSMAEIPHQGQDPERAAVLFVGLDANYSSEIFEFPDFRRRILEYHKDGVEFWRRHGVHHPFLLDEYPLNRTQGGVPYHRKFSKMGLSPELAEQITFVELLDVPTTGSTVESRFWELFNIDHARRLDALFAQGARRQVLLPSSVIKKMKSAHKKFGVFDWMPKQIDWGRFGRFGQTEIYKVRHFSGAITNDQLAAMGQQIREFCAGNPNTS